MVVCTSWGRERRSSEKTHLFGLVGVRVVDGERQVILQVLQSAERLWLGFFFKSAESKETEKQGVDTATNH